VKAWGAASEWAKLPQFSNGAKNGVRRPGCESMNRLGRRQKVVPGRRAPNPKTKTGKNGVGDEICGTGDRPPSRHPTAVYRGDMETWSPPGVTVSWALDFLARPSFGLPKDDPEGFPGASCAPALARREGT